VSEMWMSLLSLSNYSDCEMLGGGFIGFSRSDSGVSVQQVFFCFCDNLGDTDLFCHF